MWRYQQAREKWLLNSTIEADSEEVLSEDVVNIDDYKFDPEYISVDEWINIQRQEGVRHIIGNDIYLIIEDLGESNSRIIAPFTAAVLPAKDYSMYNNTFDNLVGHEAAENALSAFDLYLNACGPVWAVALGKKPLRAEDHSSFLLAVGTTQVGFPVQFNEEEQAEEAFVEFTLDGGGGPGSDYGRLLGRRESHHNLLQLWVVTCWLTSKGDSSDSVVEAGLRFCVDLRGRGSCWALRWRETDLRVEAGGDSRRFGVLAAVCGDGSCLVLVLPRDDPAPSSGGDASAESAQRVSLRAALEGSVAVTSVAWSPDGGQVCCGLSDGSLAVWVLAADQLVPSDAAPALRPGPTARFCDTSHADSEPSHCAVRSVQYCPFPSQPDLLLATGYDSNLTIWQLSDTYRPLFQKSTPLMKVLDSKWDPVGHGVYLVESAHSTVLWDNLWSPSVAERKAFYSHANKFSCIWAMDTFAHDQQSAVLTVSSDGTVRGGFSSLFVARAGMGFPPVELMRVLGVEDVSNSSTDSAANATYTAAAAVMIRRDTRLESTNHEENIFTRHLAVSMHTIDSIPLARSSVSSTADVDKAEKGVRGMSKRVSTLNEFETREGKDDRRLVAYGGAVGLIRVHSIHPIR
eukprot:CAMPEP_0170096626 /NCGR_PEP_ID=MMETSP0019_2-20121128/28712_1 /TAXON_ID=98059 /ORGANISM="Dinobryon sp., Strain UTEXLB2267" /LENGTH=628 /DNA_ID=CAMNT_0010318681 /DNA_START=176 /DNA_END=2060 /DNA_ORIENTATION=-